MTKRKYEQRLRAESARHTRERILEALVERIRSDPFGGISLEAVAEEAGVARSTVYAVFGSRAGLFDALASDSSGAPNTSGCWKPPEAPIRRSPFVRASARRWISISPSTR